MKWQPQVEQLLARTAKSGFRCAAGSAERLATYCAELASWADRSGLVSPHDLPHLVTKHIGPSLGPLLVEPADQDGRWLDVGTGGGLPGMVIKLACPSLHLTLLDSSRKKTIFLEGLSERMGLKGLKIIEGRVENLTAEEDVDCASRCDVVLMRAMAPLARALPLLSTIARPGMRFLTFKGSTLEDELSAAADCMARHGWRYAGTHEIPWARPRLVRLVQDGQGGRFT